MNRLYDFLRELRQNNNREWFAEHKDEYLHAREATARLTEKLIAAVATVDPEAARLRVEDCTYRIYRDTRFSPDKTPYKTHIGIFINPPLGKKSLTCGYYFHLEPDNSFVACGTVCLPSPVIKAIRQSIFDEIDEYRSIVEDAAFKACFPVVGENLLKTAPKGFPKDWPYVAYLRPRDFMASMPVADDLMMAPDVAERLMPAIKQAWRFNRFMNFTIEDFQ